jgi:hypothetical protein
MLQISIKTFAKNASHYLIDFKQALLRGLMPILPLSKKLSSMSRHCLVLAFQLLIPLRLLRLTPTILVTVVFSNRKFIPINLNKLLVSIQEFGIQHREIIVLLRKRFYL